MCDKDNSNEVNPIEDLVTFIEIDAEPPSESFKKKVIEKFGIEGYSRFMDRKRKYGKAARILSELAKLNENCRKGRVPKNTTAFLVDFIKKCDAIAKG